MRKQKNLKYSQPKPALNQGKPGQADIRKPPLRARKILKK